MDNSKEEHIDYDESLDEKWDNRELGADEKFAVKANFEETKTLLDAIEKSLKS